MGRFPTLMIHQSDDVAGHVGHRNAVVWPIALTDAAIIKIENLMMRTESLDLGLPENSSTAQTHNKNDWSSSLSLGFEPQSDPAILNKRHP